jgi:hypothetical protein
VQETLAKTKMPHLIILVRPKKKEATHTNNNTKRKRK